ncbi:MAG TPA: hypothetical protein VJI73_02910 [Candidatus Paceibacterota bacterium]
MYNLSANSSKIIDDYLCLPLPGALVRTPYYNNKHKGVRMGLPALVGKGTPKEIAEEALIYATREKIDLASLDTESKQRFLVDHSLGIDCSGLAYHILDAESQARDKGSLASHLQYPLNNGILSRLGRYIRRRYAQNADTLTLAHPFNSGEIKQSDLAPGDLVVLIDRGGGERNHVLVVESVDEKKVSLIHSIANAEDGKYNHGARMENFTISDQIANEIREKFRAKSIWLRRFNWL